MFSSEAAPSPFWKPLALRLKQARDALNILAFPCSCLFCGADGLPEPICGDCREKALAEARGSACPRCGQRVGPHALLDRGCSECRGQPLGFDGVISLGAYKGPLCAAVLSMKRLSGAWMCRWFADLLFQAHAPALRGFSASALVSVPLHWSRRLSRGYNQADAIAAPLARRLGLPLQKALERTRPGEKLAGLGAQDRALAMRGIFRARSLPAIEGSSLILVDDVMTTGATCGAAARALKKAGAKRVYCAVVSRTGR